MPKNEKTILVVDDEVDICEILALMFKNKGFKVLIANNGKEALDLVKKNQIDVVVSDVQMPGGDGVQLLDEIKKLNSRLPVVLFITGYASITIEDAYDKGAEAVFAKPFDNKALLQAVLRSITEIEQSETDPRPIREATDLDIYIKFPKFEISKKVKMQNIGRGGFFVTLSQDLPKLNDKALFKIEIVGDLNVTISGEGVVRWIRPQKEDGLPAGCGVEFDSFEGRGKAKIFEFVNFLKTKQYIPKL